MIAVVHGIAAVETDDGMVFDLDGISYRRSAYTPTTQDSGAGRCVDRAVDGTAAWDVSTRDPIVPAPRQVRIDRVLGDPIVLLGYAPETTIA